MKNSVTPLRSRFDRNTTAEGVTEGIDLSGKTALITGVSSGLGLETMRVLGQRGAHVIACARNIDSAQQACDQVAGHTTPVACDLSELASVASCSDQIVAMGNPIDMLICNAGIMALPTVQQKHGLELQFLTNHLGHFVLINRLLQRVQQAPAGRIVIVSSMGHQHTVKGGIGFDNLDGQRNYDPWRFYGQSKLANLLTARELARRLLGSGVIANAVHPGVIHTGLARYTQGAAAKLITMMARPFERSVAQGAATQCYVATHRDLKRVSGHYFADCNPAKSSKYSHDKALAQRLWQVSEELATDYL
jgi:NAD(P)-dependent dehydrogenase (short-subunit alcohol dehydrogenase family)